MAAEHQVDPKLLEQWLVDLPHAFVRLEVALKQREGGRAVGSGSGGAGGTLVNRPQLEVALNQRWAGGVGQAEVAEAAGQAAIAVAAGMGGVGGMEEETDPVNHHGEGGVTGGGNRGVRGGGDNRGGGPERAVRIRGRGRGLHPGQASTPPHTLHTYFVAEVEGCVNADDEPGVLVARLGQGRGCSNKPGVLGAALLIRVVGGERQDGSQAR